MIEYKWQILELSAEDGLIIHAKYFVTAIEDDKKIETEGNWWFQNPMLKVPFDQVTEQMVADWIDAENVKDGVNLITARLAEQLKSLEKTVVPPWKPQIFTPKL